MKRAIFILAFIFASFPSFSQVRKLRAFQFSYAWNNTPLVASYLWDPVNMMLTMDVQIGQIKIYSNPEQTFDIVKNYPDSVNGSNDVSLVYDVLNNDGKKMRLTLTFFHDKNPDYVALLSIYMADLSNFYYKLKL